MFSPFVLRHAVAGAGLLALLVASATPATSLRFHGNGTNDIDRAKVRIDAPAVPADVGDTDFTIEFWMRTASGNNGTGADCGVNYSWITGNIIVDRASYGLNPSWGLSISNGRVHFGVANAANEQHTLCGRKDVRDGAWHHIAVQRRLADGHLWLFVDGALENSVDGPDGVLSFPNGQMSNPSCGPNNSEACVNDPFVVFGAEKHDATQQNPSGPQYPSYRGWLDEVRFSTVLRYPASGSGFKRPTRPFVPDASTAALYHFDEGSGDVIGDAAPGGRSPGVRRFGGSPPGPAWESDTPFGASDDA